MRPQTVYSVFALSIATAIFSATARAELYRDIGPMDSYAMVKAKFPGATTETLTPAWLGEQEWLHKLTGVGLSGEIVVKSSRLYASNKVSLQYYEHLRDSLVAQSNPRDSSMIAFTSLMAESYWNEVYMDLSVAEDSATVDWVRWIPDSPVQVQHVIAKFGSGYVRKFSDENMRPYFDWTSRGVVANLSDDQQSVLSIEYSFTSEDWDEARRVRAIPAPSWRRSRAKTGKPAAPAPVVKPKQRKIPKM